MFGSNWTTEDRIVLGTLLLILILGESLIFSLRWAQNQPASDKPDYPATYETPVGAPTNAIWWTGTGPASYQAVCDRPQNREESDLCQQWRSAESAAQMVDVSWKQLWATWISIGAIGLSLWFTYKATAAAQRSAKAAEIAIEGADRPYLIVSTIEINPACLTTKGAKIQYRIRYNNHGRGPAWIKGVHYTAQVIETPGTPPDEIGDIVLSIANWPMAPDSWWGTQDFSDDVSFPVEDEVKDLIVEKKATFYFYGIAHYANASGHVHQYNFLYRYFTTENRFIPVASPFCQYT